MPLHSVVVEAASTFPCAPRVRLPPASTGCCDSPLVGPCIPPGSLAPRGARCRPPRRRRARDGPIVACARRCIRRSTCPADKRSKTATAGRPSKLTPALQEQILTSIRDGGCTYADACLKAGISTSTFQLWKQKGQEQRSGRFSDFSDELKEAEAGFRAKSRKRLSRTAPLLYRVPGIPGRPSGARESQFPTTLRDGKGIFRRPKPWD